MARKPRELIPHTAYHVTARINRQEMILENDEFKELFLQVTKRAKEKYSFKIRNFCLMGNHIHLDIEPSETENLSRIMQWILSVFARYYNNINDYKGHVWYDRFKSKAIQSFQQLINTFVYIANNPVRANLVDHPLKYAYSGISYYKNNHLGILDPPDNIINALIDTMLDNYNVDQGRKVIAEYSFLPKKGK
ncbi:MAG: transposase [Candidatus Margulisiibacteriota bacterium]|jgi:REP element-mobilizing transposase RayT